jgi:triacylglycerol lipase
MGNDYDSYMACVLALAVKEAYAKYNDPGHEIRLGGYVVKDFIYVHELEVEKVFFGFTATGSMEPGMPRTNIVALRGTQSDEEALEDMDWTPTPCVLPNVGGGQYGQAGAGVYGFYAGTDFGTVHSLSHSFKSAVSNLDGSITDWYVAGHSLGGAAATLGAFDSVVSGSYNNGDVRPKLYTYGSLHVGDADFAASFAEAVPEAYRVANLADWVPALTGLEGADTPGYVHVGLECTFLWQKWGDWENHSLVDTYLETVQQYPAVIKFGPRDYPQ